MQYGSVYFSHSTEKEYIGPKLTKQLGADAIQLDFAEMSTWYQVHKGKNYFDWSKLDEAYNRCESEGIEPIISFSHHFCPPAWVREGPFNKDFIETPQYGSKYGSEFDRMSSIERAWAEYVTALVHRYGDKTKKFVYSHEWNLNWIFYAKKGTPQYNQFLKNQIGCTLLAYKITKEQLPRATLTYGLLAEHKRDRPHGKPITSLYQTVEEWPFGPSFMVRKYLETGDRDYLELIKTTYLFYLSHTDNPNGLTPIYMDASAGDAAEALYKAQVSIDRKNYRYIDYIHSFIILPFSTTGVWNFNRDRGYTEKEQSSHIIRSVENILAAKRRGTPIEMILFSLVDKNEYYSSYAFEPWRYCPEGLYRLTGRVDPFRQGAMVRKFDYRPKEAVRDIKRKVSTSTSA